MIYEPRGAAFELFHDRGSEVLMSGPAGTGKTVAALMKLHLTSLMVPNVQSLVVRATHASLTGSTLMAFEKYVAAQEIGNGTVSWFGGSGSKPPGYRYPNGSIIMVGGMDRPGKVLSASLDRIVADECNQLSVTAWETLLTRLRGSAATYKQAVAATNPDHPGHWLKQRADDPGSPMKLYTSLHKDNPYLFSRSGEPTAMGDNYLRILRDLTGIRRARYYEGRWMAQEGLVFDDWRDDVNIIGREDVPELSYRLWSVDFGYSNPFSWQEWGVDHDERMYLLREIHKTRTLVEDHAREIRDLTGYQPRAIVCDHDAEDRATLERHLGLPTVAARKGVSRGIQLVQSRMRVAGDGKPRFYVVRDSLLGRDDVAEREKRPRGFLGEVSGYVWETVRGSDGIPREHPVKQHDHSMDNARYAVAYLDWHGPAKAGSPAAPSAAAAAPGGMFGGILSRPVGR